MKRVIYLYIPLSLLIIVYLIWLHYSREPEILEVEKIVYKEVEKPKYITKIRKIYVKVPEVQVLEKEKIVEKEKDLPEWFKSATEQVILAVGEIPPYKGKTRVFSLLNTKTGEGTLIYKPLSFKEPFLQFKKDLRIGAGWDFINQSGIGRLDFDFMRISKINFSIISEVHKEGFKSGIFLWTKF